MSTGCVRHPIYGGLVLASLGWGLLTASPATIGAAIVLLGFFELKSRREEAWLEDASAPILPTAPGPVGSSPGSVELADEPVDRVEERLGDLRRQRVPDRVLHAVGGPAARRGRS